MQHVTFRLDVMPNVVMCTRLHHVIANVRTRALPNFTFIPSCIPFFLSEKSLMPSLCTSRPNIYPTLRMNAQWDLSPSRHPYRTSFLPNTPSALLSCWFLYAIYPHTHHFDCFICLFGCLFDSDIVHHPRKSHSNECGERGHIVAVASIVFISYDIPKSWSLQIDFHHQHSLDVVCEC